MRMYIQYKRVVYIAACDLIIHVSSHPHAAFIKYLYLSQEETCGLTAVDVHWFESSQVHKPQWLEYETNAMNSSLESMHETITNNTD